MYSLKMLESLECFRMRHNIYRSMTPVRLRWFLIGLVCLLPLQIIPAVDAVAVMSVDLGSEWMKVAIVSPGVPMEIALNKESKRKTPVAISFRDGEREIGDDALNVRVRFPELTYTHLLDLLGKELENPMVQLYKKRFAYHRLLSDPVTNTVIFEKEDDAHFSVEELLSMILHRAREYAQDFAGQPIKDVVITVPVFFNQAERRAVMRAAELANLKVLQLINANTAVALNYGVFRRKDFNATIQRILFYDMGASSTTATIVGYQVVKTKERGFTETNPQLSILGVGYDRTLGGVEFTLRLRDHLAKTFNEQKKTKTDVYSVPRAMSKLLKEAERVKMVLSANNDHFAQVENLLEDIDFRAPVTRAEFEEMCSDLFERVGSPVELSLNQAAMTLDDIDQVILVGAATRIPRLQEKLLGVVKKPELGKNLNTDEAAAMGAVYQAAHLSQGFKVKKFVVKDAVLYPIQVDFERDVDSEDGSKGIKVVSRTLFALLNPYPLKKVMTFNRLAKDDFTFKVNYGTLSLSPEDQRIFGSRNISQVNLSGIKEATAKHSADGSESRGVKAHFRMDESGLLTLDLVESVFEKKEEAEEESDMESTLSKLGNTISKLFSGGSDEAEPAQTANVAEETKSDGKPTEEASNETKDENSNATETESTTQEQVGDTEVPKNQTTNQTIPEMQGNATASTEGKGDKANATKPVSKKPKLVLIKEPIQVEQETVDVKEPTKDQLKGSRLRIETFNKKERAQREKAEAKNSLESFILDTQDKLYQEQFEVASTEEEREKIRTQLSQVSDWLYEEEVESEAEVYRAKLKDLQSLTKDLYGRVKEHKDRPEALNALRDLLNMSEAFLSKARSLSDDDQYFTAVELDMLEKVINETKQWKKEKQAEQAKQPLTEKPLLTVRSIAEKLALLDREVKYLVNKARTSKPKPKKPATSDANNKTGEEAESDTKSETTADGQEEIDISGQEPEPQIDTPTAPSAEESTEEPPTTQPEETITTEESSPEDPQPTETEKEKQHTEL